MKYYIFEESDPLDGYLAIVKGGDSLNKELVDIVTDSGELLEDDSQVEVNRIADHDVRIDVVVDYTECCPVALRFYCVYLDDNQVVRSRWVTDND